MSFSKKQFFCPNQKIPQLLTGPVTVGQISILSQFGQSIWSVRPDNATQSRFTKKGVLIGTIYGFPNYKSL